MKKATFIVLSLLLTITFYGQTNVVTGTNAGFSLTTSGINNVMTGVRAGTKTTTGDNNVFTGFEAGRENVSGNNNVFAGYLAGAQSLYGENVFIGTEAGRKNKSSDNVYSGFQVAYNDEWGTGNVFTGYKSGFSNLNGNYNVYIGFASGYSIGTGDSNVFIGNYTANNLKVGSNNTFVGTNAGSRSTVSNTAIVNNTYIGVNAGFNASGSNCVFLGNSTGTNVTTSDKLYIDNSSTPTPLIYGDFLANQVGINTTTIPTGVALAVGGNVAVSGLTASDVLATSFKKEGGLADEFLMADGNTKTVASLGITDAFKNIRRLDNPITLDDVSESGIYRQETPSSSFNYTTTLNMNSIDGRQQLTIERAGLGMKFRGSNTGGTANDFSSWKTVIHNENIGEFGIRNQISAPQLNTNMWISGNGIFGGNVGIGTTDPKNKLSVNGTIWAKEVKVSLTDAADWVFDKNYKLKPLADVEKYINANKHLPEVPSAEEFRQNDMNVSEMSNKLLQKIEELTLYAIAQQKELDRLKTENEKYKSLAERLSAIEKELKK